MCKSGSELYKGTAAYWQCNNGAWTPSDRIPDCVGKKCFQFYYGALSRDVTSAILVFQNNETTAMLVSQTNPLGFEFLSYANAFFWKFT